MATHVRSTWRRAATVAIGCASLCAYVACSGDTELLRDMSALADASILDGSDGTDGSVAERDAAAPPPPPPPQIESCAPISTGAVVPVSSPGTRLHIRHLVADGLDLAGEIVDVRFDSQCAFTPLDDGSLACVPNAYEIETPVAFSDTQCTTPINLSPYGAPLTAPEVVRRGSSSPGHCTADIQIAAVGPEITPTPGTIYVPRSYNPCFPEAVGSRHVYAASIVAGALVTATPHRVALTPGTDAVVLQGSDGSSHFVGELFDTIHGGRVKPTKDPSGVVRLLPDETSGVLYGPRTTPPSDAGDLNRYCGGPGEFFALQGAACRPFGPDATMIYWNPSRYSGDASAAGVFHLRLGTPTVWACQCAEGCYRADPIDAGPGFVLDAPIPLCAMAPAPDVIVGTGRLRATVASVGGAPLATAAPVAADKSLHDTALGQECVARVADDGVLRCIPHAPSAAWIGYSDAACTQRVAVFPAAGGAPDGGAMPPPPTYAASRSRYGQSSPSKPQCDPTVYEVLAPTTVTQLYGPAANDCGCYALGTAGVVTYSVGAAVPASTFAAVSITLP